MSTTTLQTFTDKYQYSLTEYLRGAGERALEQAYELGRSALGAGLGVLDISRTFTEAISSILPLISSATDTENIIGRATLFLSESLSPFEMTHRGFQETISSLRERTDQLSNVNEELWAENTERKRIEGELEQSLALLRATLDATADGILVLSSTGAIESYNRRLLEMWELKKDFPLLHPADEVMTEILKKLKNPELFTGEVRDFSRPDAGQRLITVETKDGKIFECHSHPQPTGKDPGRVWSFRDVTARRRAEDALRALAKRVVEIQEEERQRVSRELHDDVSQRLTAIKLHMELFEDDLEQAPPDSRERFGEIKRQVSDAITAVRRISSNLRPTALDDFGLVIALQHLCAEFEKLHNIKIQFQTNSASQHRYDTQMEIALYRIAQEALSNIAKHAGGETLVSMRLTNPAGSLVALDVEDSGKGFEIEKVQNHKSPRRGMGLISMKERSEMLGGTFRIESKPKKGTKIHVEIPVRK